MKKKSVNINWFKWHLWPIPKDFPILSIYEAIAYTIFLVICIVVYFDIQKVPVFRNHVTFGCIYKSPKDSLKYPTGSLYFKIPMSYTFSNEKDMGETKFLCFMSEFGQQRFNFHSLKNDSLLDALMKNAHENIDKSDLPSLLYIKYLQNNDYINYDKYEFMTPSFEYDKENNNISYINNYRNNDGIVCEGYVGLGKGGFGNYLIQDAKRNASYSRPTWYRLYDISQMYFDLKIQSDYIDFIKIDFVGATQFSNISPEPDEISMSGIQYTDREKIDLLSSTGLKFHAKFIELDKVQNARMFFMSALCSAMLAIFIAFIVLGSYKTISNIVKGMKIEIELHKQNEKDSQKESDKDSEDTSCTTTNNT